MDSDQANNALLMEIFEVLNSKDGDRMRSLLQSVLNVTMNLEREEALGAKPYERCSERKGQANGFKPKTLNSHLGA